MGRLPESNSNGAVTCSLHPPFSTIQMMRFRVDDGDRAPKFRGAERDVSPLPANLPQQEGVLTTFGGKAWNESRGIGGRSGGTQGLGEDVGQTVIRKVINCLLSRSPLQER